MSRFTVRCEFQGSDLREALERFRDVTIPEGQRAAIREGMVTALVTAVEATSVETGRARSAWNDALAELGSGVGGFSLTTGGVREGTVTRTETAHSSEVVVTNEVPYITFLEYGTQRQRPRPMVGPALHAAAEVLPELLRQRLLAE
jgi:hypothetical protein